MLQHPIFSKGLKLLHKILVESTQVKDLDGRNDTLSVKDKGRLIYDSLFGKIPCQISEYYAQHMLYEIEKSLNGEFKNLLGNQAKTEDSVKVEFESLKSTIGFCMDEELK